MALEVMIMFAIAAPSALFAMLFWACIDMSYPLAVPVGIQVLSVFLFATIICVVVLIVGRKYHV